MSSPFNVISLFAGCGGSSLGYEMAGGNILLAVEWDNNAVEIYHLNHPTTQIFHGDIADLSIGQCLESAGLKMGELDILDGSPPCQGFSTAGKRIMEDPRNELFHEYIRLLSGLMPKVLVMENVSGMIKGKMKLIFAEIMQTLKASGYEVKCRLMNAMYYGVPQSRQRVIFIGVRKDLKIWPSHPNPKMKPIPAKAVISGLVATRSQHINPWIDGRKPAATICKSEYGYQALAIPESELEEAKIKDSWQMKRVLEGKEAKKHYSLVRLNPDKPSPTIQKDAGNTTSGLVHSYQIRKLTISEIKRLSSYPDDYKFIGSYKDKWARIGNSVPPLFMKAIAEHIRDEILAKI